VDIEMRNSSEYAEVSSETKGVQMFVQCNTVLVLIGLFTIIAADASKAAEPSESASKSSGQLPDAVLRQTKPLFDSKTLDGWIQLPANSWEVNDGAIASRGLGRGVIYSAKDYAKFRLVFLMRHVSGKPDHQPCVLIFCTRPENGKKPLDALGGIQFQPPNGGHWDYRPGHNNGGKGFTRLTNPKFKPGEWSEVELLVDSTTGTARMAVAQPVGTKAVEVLRFKGPDAGRTGPIALQMHNKGLFDEYKDVRVETDPKSEDLITTM
jgi:hypothetical protein